MGTAFFDYYTDDRPPRNLIREWYVVQDDRVRVAFDNTIVLLEAMPDWANTDVLKEFTRAHIGLSELVIDLKDKKPFRHVRPLGICHREERIFILLGGVEKSGRIYTPSDAFEKALKHKSLFEAGRGAISEHI